MLLYQRVRSVGVLWDWWDPRSADEFRKTQLDIMVVEAHPNQPPVELFLLARNSHGGEQALNSTLGCLIGMLYARLNV